MPNRESRIRWYIRSNRLVQRSVYAAQSLRYSNFGRLCADARKARGAAAGAQGVALCLRFRNEARYLREWLEYYLAAGIAHFFLYESFSNDDFHSVLQPYVDRGLVTLMSDWPNVPVSPAADEDCLRRAMGRYQWVGFFDADEFVVIDDGASICEFLGEFEDAPGVALHCYPYGANGHKTTPAGPVIESYTRRERNPDCHLKCFVRPELVAQYRNPHSFYFLGMRHPVNELGARVGGSLSFPVTARHAWINHYYCKSEEDYLRRAKQGSKADRMGDFVSNRSPERLAEAMASSNEVFDDRALRYYQQRCRRVEAAASALLSVASE
jgi:hypothetical protein